MKMQKQSSLSNKSATSRIRYEEQLNSAQLEAVTTTEGFLLVIAGAGSAKTRTLTYRVAQLLEDAVSSVSILQLTFARKTAQQILLRAAELLDRRCGKIAGGTFHSFGNTILRKLEEELRLMYVAATLARDNLIFTYPNQVHVRKIGMMPDRLSRFIDMAPQCGLAKQSARVLI